MRLNTLIRGRAGNIEIRGEHFRYQREDGQVLEGEFSRQAMGGGVYSILIGDDSYRVYPGAPGEVTVNGEPIAIELTDPRAMRSRKDAGSAAGLAEIIARMPGKVVSVLVAAGDSVTAGQGLLVVEAMKMQNEVTSPKSGRVAAVRAKPGSAVAAGDVLMVVE